jgi:hypothetical protein
MRMTTSSKLPTCRPRAQMCTAHGPSAAQRREAQDTRPPGLTTRQSAATQHPRQGDAALHIRQRSPRPWAAAPSPPPPPSPAAAKGAQYSMLQPPLSPPHRPPPHACCAPTPAAHQRLVQLALGPGQLALQPRALAARRRLQLARQLRGQAVAATGRAAKCVDQSDGWRETGASSLAVEGVVGERAGAPPPARVEHSSLERRV